MKGIIMMLTVALVMAVMMMASVMPAFAQGRGEGHKAKRLAQKGATRVKEFPKRRRSILPRERVDRNPSPSGARSLRRASTTHHRALFAPLQGLLSIPQKDANRR